MFGLPPSHYEKYPILKENFNILTTAKDRNGVEYVSSAEHKRYPFFATQWHPEKPPFEFGMQEVVSTILYKKCSCSFDVAFLDKLYSN